MEKKNEKSKEAKTHESSRKKKKIERGKVEGGKVDDLEQTFISCQLVRLCVYVCVV